MDLNSNLNFSEVIVRYAILMAIGITAGATQQFWLVIPAMLFLLSGVLGWDPVKAYKQKRKAEQVNNKSVRMPYKHKMTA